MVFYQINNYIFNASLIFGPTVRYRTIIRLCLDQVVFLILIAFGSKMKDFCSMAYTVNQIEKQTIVARLSVSLYQMNEFQLEKIMNLLENKDNCVDGVKKDSMILPSEDSSIKRQMIIAQIFILINNMDKDTLLLRLRPFSDPIFRWVREYPRLPCYILVDFAAKGRAYRSNIRDISASGVFIETKDAFKVGQEIALCFALTESGEILPFKLKGSVTRVYPDGIGVQYSNMTNYQREIINVLIGKSH